MTISAVAGPWYRSAFGTTLTLTVDPTALGDVIVLQITAANASTIVSISGGGVTTWQVAEGTVGPALYFGVVTATGTSTITVVNSGSFDGMRAQQFHSTLGDNWHLVASNTAVYGGGGGANSGNYPSVTATGAAQLYIATTSADSESTLGSTAGYVYDNGWDLPPLSKNDSFVYFLNAASPTAYSPAWSTTPGSTLIFSAGAAILTADAYTLPPGNNVAIGFSAAGSTTISKVLLPAANLATSFAAAVATNSGFAPSALVPWQLPVSINDHAYMLDFAKTRITTLQVRRQSADDSVEPGEQTLSAAGVWPRAQDNYFLGAGQEFLDNRFAFESVYVHSGEYPSVRTRFWKSQGINPWSEGKMTMLPEYEVIAGSSAHGGSPALIRGAVLPGGFPLVVTTGVNDQFVYTPEVSGIPATITVAAGSYASGTDVQDAVNFAAGYTLCIDEGDGSFALVAQVNGPSEDGSTATTGTGRDLLADLGFTSPAVFEGGVDAVATPNLLLVVCGDYLYYTDGPNLWWTLDPVGVPSPSWTQVTLASTTEITSITSDGSRVWVATGADGVYVTDAGSTSSTAAATPVALNGIGGAIAAVAGAGTVDATNLPNGSTTWYISEVDAFGNETAAVGVTATVASTPVNLTWNPDTNASNFNVYRGTGTLIYTGDVPSFVDDGTVAGTSQTRPTSNGTGTTPYQATFILYAKGHLIASTGRDLVEILASGNITFIYQNENPNFVFNCGCELPSAIIVAGNAGGVNSGLAFVGALQPDATNNGATLAPPTWATALPYGEQINAIAYNAGSILLATSLGVRTGTDANNSGVFNINPVIESPGPVLCTAAWAQYQYFGWSNYQPSEPWAPARPLAAGLGRADLSQYTTPGVPAYASDVMLPAESVTLVTTQVVVIAGVPYFVVYDSTGDNYYLCGPDGKVVESAWYEPGWIRYGTLEKKIVTEVDFQHEALPAGASVDYSIVYEDMTTVVDVVTNSAAGSTTLETPETAGLLVGDRFMPVITLTSTPAQDAGPVFLSHITKAMVTTLRQDEVLLALVFADEVRSLGPATKTQYMNPAQEYIYLKGFEGTGQIITLTMGGLVYSAFIDQVMYEPDNEMENDRQWFKGTCTVKLVTLSRTSSQ